MAQRTREDVPEDVRRAWRADRRAASRAAQRDALDALDAWEDGGPEPSPQDVAEALRLAQDTGEDSGQPWPGAPTGSLLAGPQRTGDPRPVDWYETVPGEGEG